MARIISQGAEATIVLDKGKIIKDRVRKRYRIREIDERLRKSRTRREVKIIEKLNQIGIAVPKLFDADNRDMKIFMEKVKGKRLRDVLERLNYVNVCKSLGEQIAQLHNNDIIHGDITTSNMIINNNKINFIDFGLGEKNSDIEKKGVDLHVLMEAIESTHSKYNNCFEYVIEGYKKELKNNANLVINKINDIIKRGRYK